MIEPKTTGDLMLMVDEKERDVLTMERIQEVVCRLRNIPVSSLHQRCRQRDLSDTRHIVFSIACRSKDKFRPALSLSKIGLFYCMDHTSVLHADRMVQSHYDVEKDFRILVQRALFKLSLNPNLYESSRKQNPARMREMV